VTPAGGAVLELSQVAERLAVAAAKILAAEAAVVLLLEKDQPTVAAVHGVSLKVGARFAAPLLPVGDEPVVVEDARADPHGPPLPPGLSAALCLSLRTEEARLGALHIYESRPRQFDAREIDRAQALANLGSAAIQSAQRLAKLERIEADKSQFVRIATHELRSPVAVSQSLVRAVLKEYAGPLTDQQKDVFGRVARRLDFLERLVNDLLDLAAGKAPQLAEQTEPVAVNASVGRAVLLLQPRAEEKGVTLTLHRCCEELAIWATEEGLDRIFVNLVGNAIKYTPPGGRVDVRMERVGQEVRVSVADTGIGIPAEAMPHLFEEFYRAPNARSVEESGTGLGLAIVKDLVGRYGGSIDVQSKVDQGTTFTTSFPVCCFVG